MRPLKRPRVPLVLDNLLWFTLFAFSNALLAYVPIPIQTKLWIGLGGIGLPFFWVWRNGPKGDGQRGKPPYLREGFLTPAWSWVVLTVLALGLRLGQTCVPGYWPVWDDGRFAYYSMELADHWSWRFFFSPTQHPPFFNWTLALFFKCFKPSLFTLWLYPAACSAISFFFGTLAARTLFSRSFSFLCGFLLAVSFFPLYAGRFCMYMADLVLMETLTLFFLARLLSGRRPADRWKAAIGLGLCTAAGFWVAIAWPAVALSVLIAVFGAFGRPGRTDPPVLRAVLIPLSVSAALFVGASFLEKNGVHIHQLMAFGEGASFGRQLTDSLSNLTVLFWGCDLQNAYGPVWGGVLNPILAAFFFIGILECIKWGRNGMVRWMILSLGLLAIPGLVTRNFDLFRNTQVLPPVLLVTAMGIQCLVLGGPSVRRKLAIGALLLLSTGLDLRGLWLSYHPEGREAGSNGPCPVVDKRAYEVLEEEFKVRGYGALFFDLEPHEADQTLSVATYGFNATQNPGLPLESAKWVAFLIDPNYRPFLAERFPRGKWYSLQGGEEKDSLEPRALFILPVDPDLLPTLRKWKSADRAFREVVWLAANVPEDQGRGGIFERLPGIHPLVQGDRLLESIYWGMVYDFHRWENVYGDKDTAVHFPASLEAVQQAIGEGYATAYFYNELGGLWFAQKDYARARQAFQKAVDSTENDTEALSNLEFMQRNHLGGP
jgi:hypothetical protein